MRVSREISPLFYPFAAMVFIVTLSNYLVMFPINDWLTWGALPYPISFLVTELTNRVYGPRTARRVIYLGFAWAVLLSIGFATPKIALASGSAFLISQLLDVFVFNAIRRTQWWMGPFFASFAASVIDTLIFWNIAFYGGGAPILMWMAGDFSVKLLLDVAMLIPFRLAIRRHFLPSS